MNSRTVIITTVKEGQEPQKTDYYLRGDTFQTQTSDGTIYYFTLPELSANKLPSKYQIGDSVNLNFGGESFIVGKVIKVHFTESKVSYDLEVKVENPNTSWFTRLYNVDSALIVE